MPLGTLGRERVARRKPAKAKPKEPESKSFDTEREQLIQEIDELRQQFAPLRLKGNQYAFSLSWIADIHGDRFRFQELLQFSRETVGHFVQHGDDEFLKLLKHYWDMFRDCREEEMYYIARCFFENGPDNLPLFNKFRVAKDGTNYRANFCCSMLSSGLTVVLQSYAGVALYWNTNRRTPSTNKMIKSLSDADLVNLRDLLLSFDYYRCNLRRINYTAFANWFTKRFKAMRIMMYYGEY